MGISLESQPTTYTSTRTLISVAGFSGFAYLAVGLPLAVLPALIVKDLQYSPFIAGVIISLQYVATLLTRPQAGAFTDRHGARFVVLLGLACCALSGLTAMLAIIFLTYPIYSMCLLAASRLFLGASESYCSTGATLWGMSLVAPHETARVISWNGAACYLAMAIGAPCGVWLNANFGAFSFGLCTLIMASIGFILAYQKAAPVQKVLPKNQLPLSHTISKVWVLGLGLAIATLGFGILSTFISLFFLEKGWTNAALALSLFSIGFVATRFIFSHSIAHLGGKKVALISCGVEAIGLILIGLSDLKLLVYVGAILVGAGFSLIFPALGIETIKKFSEQNKGIGLGVFTAFFDLALIFVGPIAGFLIPLIGISQLYSVTGGVLLLGVGGMFWLLRHSEH